MESAIRSAAGLSASSPFFRSEPDVATGKIDAHAGRIDQGELSVAFRRFKHGIRNKVGGGTFRFLSVLRGGRGKMADHPIADRCNRRSITVDESRDRRIASALADHRNVARILRKQPVSPRIEV